MKARIHHSRVKAWIGPVLGLVTLALYLPVLTHSFVQYDDQQYVTENPHVQAGLTVGGFLWSFGFHAGNWHPLAWLSHMLDCQIYGARAWGHHLTNVLLHAATTVLLYRFLRRTTGAVWRSAAVAALFGWHPLHVESVAWVAERKDVLCAFFWMLTLLAYARYSARPAAGGFAVCLGLFALALMSKPMAVTLPFVLTLMDLWPLGRFAALGSAAADPAVSVPALSWGRLLLEKVPFLTMSAGACYLTVKAQQEAIVSTAGLPVASRLAHVMAAYGHYVYSMFIPRNLVVYYPYELALPATTIMAAALLIAVVTVAAIVWIRSRPWLAVGWFWYLGTLVPVIGLVQVGDQAWADRYTYLPLVGLFIMCAWEAAVNWGNRLWLRVTAAAAGIMTLALTSVQISYWKDTTTLFSHADEATRDNYMAMTVLGSQLAQAGKLDEAMDDYRRALRLKPNFPEAHFFMGNALEQQGKLEDAVAEYQSALWFKPMQEQTHIFLGMVLARQLRYDEAIAQYLLALQIDPDSAVTQNNLARIYHTRGQFDEAAKHYQAALQIDPKLALAHNNYGILLLQKDRPADGALQLHEALQLSPTNTETQYNLALADNQLAQWAEASDLFAKTVGPGNTDSRAHCEFAVALAHLHKTREAMSQYASALLLQPDYPQALDGLAWILATSPQAEIRNGTQSVAMANRACELTGGKEPQELKTLAAAYAETGQFDAAVHAIQKAAGLASPTNRDAAELRLMLKQFQNSQPWRSE